MNSVIFLVSIISMQSGVQITSMNSMNQCISVRDSIHEQTEKLAGIKINKNQMWCYNSSTKVKLIVGQHD